MPSFFGAFFAGYHRQKKYSPFYETPLDIFRKSGKIITIAMTESGFLPSILRDPAAGASRGCGR